MKPTVPAKMYAPGPCERGHNKEVVLSKGALDYAMDSGRKEALTLGAVLPLICDSLTVTCVLEPVIYMPPPCEHSCTASACEHRSMGLSQESNTILELKGALNEVGVTNTQRQHSPNNFHYCLRWWSASQRPPPLQWTCLHPVMCKELLARQEGSVVYAQFGFPGGDGVASSFMSQSLKSPQ